MEITGQQITKIRTMGSKFDEGRLIILEDDGGTEYRMDVNELMKILNDDVRFDATQKKIHRYLSIKTDNSREEVVSN